MSAQNSWLASSLEFPKIPIDEGPVEKTAELHWPFELKGGLILIEACVDDHRKQFLLDSGAPNLFINGLVDKESAKFSAIGMNGSLDIAEKTIKHFQMGNILQKEVKAFQLDISHLEEAKDCKMGGIIGYDQIKDHEILIDYEAKKLSIVEPGNTALNAAFELEECIPFKLQGHFAVIEVIINKKVYHFGIDTGAETNVLNKKLYNKLKRNAILESNKIAVRGIDKNHLTVRKCLLRNLLIADKSYPGQEFVFSELKHLNKTYGIQLDGLLGYPFLKDHLYSLNYRDNAFCIWQKKPSPIPNLPITYHKEEQ